ncbi:MAG: permease-like cell division protein FtsX [Cellvibrionaceae bacterium]
MPQVQRPPSSGRGASRSPNEAPVKSAPRGAGASTHKTRWSDRWQSYLAHHRHSAKDSLSRLLSAPLQSLMTWMVMAVALALPATLFSSLNNVQSLGQSWDGAPQLSVFLNVRAREPAIEAFLIKLKDDAQIADVIYQSPEQALREFEETSGMGRALQTLDRNPLPPTVLIIPAAGLTPLQLSQLEETLADEALVDDVVFDRAWVERLYQMLNLAEKVVFGLGGLLLLGVLLVIGNTIRLSIESRRDEIVIIKLVGGTDAFVRRPFLYTGFWYGLGGGVIALLLLALLLWLLAAPVASLAVSYQSDFELQGLGFFGSALLVALAAAIGWLGAWLAVSRHLGDIEPK